MRAEKEVLVFRGSFLVDMRKLRISAELLRSVAGDKDMIDALAFVLLIKQQRVNSVITKATLRRLKSLLKIGTDKLRKVLRKSLDTGLVRYEGKHLVAARLHDSKSLSLLISRAQFIDAARRSRSGKLNITGARLIVEAAIVTNQVGMQNSCADTHYRATEGRSVRTIRSARQRESRMLRKPFDTTHSGLSNKRIQQLIGRKHGKAVKVVRYAVQNKILSKRIREKEFNVVGETYGAIMRALCSEQNIIVWVQRHCARLRFANEYKVINRQKVINVANHG